MPKAKMLSDEERITILANARANMSDKDIATLVDRNINTIRRFLKDPDAYGTAKHPGRPPLLDPTSRRRLIREATKGKASSRQLVTICDLPVKDRRVRQLLQSDPKFVYKKRLSGPVLTDAHKKARLKYAQQMLVESRDWSAVIFSDEKKFNLDGPDGWQYYWHHLDHEEQWFSKRQSGGGGIMVWGAFSSLGKSELCVLEGKQDSFAYTVTLSDYMLPFGHANYGHDFVFMQDNASIHTSRETRRWFSDNNITILPHPAKSPDLNPIENLWAIVARRVYANGRQFLDQESLKRAVFAAWDEISTEVLKNLVNSMPNRCTEVLLNSGKKSSIKSSYSIRFS